MAVLLAVSFVSGVITILSPCILPVLPIVLAGGAGGGRRRPFGIIAGFVSGFVFFTLALSALVRALGIPPDILRTFAVVFIVAFALILLVPKLRTAFELLASRLASAGGSGKRSGTGDGSGGGKRSGFLGGIPVGLSLGLLWTPCVGPIMASIISLAVTRGADGGSVLITLAYALGTSIPMLAIMLGGRQLLSKVPFLTRNTARIQKGFGVLLLVVGLGIGFGWDRRFQTFVLRAFPEYGTGLTALEDTEPVRNALDRRDGASEGARDGSTAGNPAGSGAAMVAIGAEDTVFKGAGGTRPKPGVLSDYGRAPSLVTGTRWFNTENAASGSSRKNSGDGTPPLSMESLRGKVVLIDFWTYSCINCIRTIPYLQAWHDEYADDGLVIVGVHSPEFEFEKDAGNVEQAMEDLGVTWPVMLDNDFRQWKAYGNRYWPAHYFIDAEGRVRYFQFGEGRYEESERVIKALLEEAGKSSGNGIVSRRHEGSLSKTPETYLGYARTKGFSASPSPVRDRSAEYVPARMLSSGEWSLGGTWTFTSQYVVPESDGRLDLAFNAKNVFLVIEPESGGGELEVRLDGGIPPDTGDVKNGLLVPSTGRMYRLVELRNAGEHRLELSVRGNLRLFAFTFG